MRRTSAGDPPPHRGVVRASRAPDSFGSRAASAIIGRRRVGRIMRGVTQRQPDPAPGAEPERGFIAAVVAPGVDPDEDLGEFRELARTAGVEPSGELLQQRPRPDPRTYVGKGKLEELKRAYADSGAEVMLVDDELSPSQQRQLENALSARVVDRTQLILDIFAQHAVTAEGKLQVELAQLEYNLPRMRGMWQHLERLGGGVGTRGPGESQLESDRRLARSRIALLRRRLRGLSRQRATSRKERRRSHTPTIALAGYTNVGKSTLLNALTGAEASVHNRLFETLDPTTRAFEHDGRRYLVTDTVGFIRRLPTQLVEGFAATLEETLVADLVLHVLDASTPDGRLDEMRAAVDAVLAEIGADALPIELVLNKIDGVDPLRRRRLENRFPGALQVSALTGEGLDALRAGLAARFADRFEEVRLLVPYDEGAKLAELYALGAPIDERVDRPEGVLVRARLPHGEVRRFARYLVAEAHAAPARSSR
jgi:GTP-binding protein HflX